MIQEHTPKYEAIKLLNANRIDEAKTLFVKICDADPDDIDAWQTLSNIYGALGLYRDSERCARHILEIDPESDQAHSSLGCALMEQGQDQDAMKHLTLALELNPASSNTCNNLGNLLLKHEKYDDAEKYYRQATHLAPEFAEAYNNLGCLLSITGHTQEAVNAWQQTLAIRPDYHQVNHHIVNALLRLGNYEDAIVYLNNILVEDPDDFSATLLLGKCLQQSGRFSEAIDTYHRAAAIAPDRIEAYQYCGNLHHQTGNFAEAARNYERAVRIDPTWSGGWLDLSAIYLSMGEHEAATRACTRILNSDPDHSKALNNLGMIFQNNGDFEGAKKLFEKSIKHDPSFVDGMYNLGFIYTTTRQHDDALAIYRRILQIDPGHEQAIIGIADILEHQGNFKEANDYLQPLINASTDNIYALATYAQLSRALGQENEAIRLLEAQAGRNNLTYNNKLDLHFSLGKLYDNSASYDKSFSHYRLANTIKRATFDPRKHQLFVEGLTQTFSSELLRSAPRSTNMSDTPVFIIAMPRSGTSLVEQILSCHPYVFGAGELNDMSAASAEFKTRASADSPPIFDSELITKTHLNLIAEKHLARLGHLSQSALRVTDKAINNYLNLGLIELLFPNARIIYCRRNPLDVCLSCYFTNFNSGHQYSYDLENLASYYIEYRKLMDHWQQVLRLPILEVRYEELVNDLEANARSMIDFLGLDWDAACLDFHKKKGLVKTVSYDQVRRPVYTSSIDRWKNYEKHIGVLTAALRDVPY